MIRDIPFDSHQWAKREAATLPERWRWRVLLQRERDERAGGEVAANAAFLSLMARLQRAPAPLDATDADICDRAQRLADECGRLAPLVADVTAAGAVPLALAAVARRAFVTPPRCDRAGPAVARLCCAQWWRRQLRRQHARAVEGSAIALGYVSKRGDCYVSEETLARRAQQLRRNARTLEETEAENERGQRYTLAQLAALGPANKAIRRGELVTRLKGFECIARDLGHAATFLTITCPSRMHANLRDGSRNPRHDGTRPDEAQAYLCKVWARIRAALARASLQVYGFRIAEPHGDGCPHWHLILFHATAGQHRFRGRWYAPADALLAIVRHYALADSPDEPGAAVARVKAEAIDPAKGSAVGYVIKYIAKAIDGFRLGEWHIDGDLAGGEELNLSPRVEAWAATWGVRQFQQIGGPPVGLWREVRRLPGDALADASLTLRDAWIAAQKFTDRRVPDPDGVPCVVRQADWGEFTRTLGGPVLRRADRPLRVVRAVPWPAQRTATRYGEEVPAVPLAVEAAAVESVPWYRRAGGICGDMIVTGGRRALAALVGAVRHVWRIVGRGSSGARAARAVPRTRFNNCTDGAGLPVRAPVDNRPLPHWHGPPLPAEVIAQRWQAWLAQHPEESKCPT